MPFKQTILLSITLFVFSCSFVQQTQKPTHHSTNLSSYVVPGVENLLRNHLDLLKGKRVGLVTNPSGVDHNLHSTADLFAANPAINLTTLFGPEHGIRGAVSAGESVSDQTDPKTGIPVYSLYGKQRKPTAKMLSKVDVLVVDLQDIGVRAYTYVYTMALVMQAGAEHHIPVIVLDRPNPIGGDVVEGNLVEDGFFSFVGLYPIPYRHGMTIGELARLFNEEYGIHCDLTVIPVQGWKRSMLWDETHLPWILPSPHVPHWQTVLFMSSTGTFGELHTLSEGVGYTLPFELVGAPWINGTKLANVLNALHLPGVRFRPLYFKPYYGLFSQQICQGVQIHLTNPRVYQSYVTGLYIMQTVMRLYPEHDLFAEPDRVRMFNKVMGCDWITNDLKQDIPVKQIQAAWQDDLERFKAIRAKYVLYQ